NWSSFLDTPMQDGVHFLLFAHPFSTPIDDLVGALDQAYPSGRKVGGLASGGNTPETMAVFLGQDTYFDGAVGCAIWGDVAFDVIVAQGCRPIGPQLKVTKAAGTHLFELDGERALDRVTAVLNSISEEERILARRTVFVGVAMEAHEKEGDQQYDGGYLVRNIMGASRDTGEIHVGHELHAGQTVRLQVRDARTADQELVGMLERYGQSLGAGAGSAAAFMFQCNGRGTNLFGREGHDAEVFERAMGPLPLAGFFCNGEIGPVGEVTYLHGYTSSIGILRPKHAAPNG
ncbi:MAG: FIST signal transduction protein, partial [Tepidiformaceae bacterium]